MTARSLERTVEAVRSIFKTEGLLNSVTAIGAGVGGSGYDVWDAGAPIPLAILRLAKGGLKAPRSLPSAYRAFLSGSDLNGRVQFDRFLRMGGDAALFDGAAFVGPQDVIRTLARTLGFDPDQVCLSSGRAFAAGREDAIH